MQRQTGAESRRDPLAALRMSGCIRRQWRFKEGFGAGKCLGLSQPRCDELEGHLRRRPDFCFYIILSSFSFQRRKMQPIHQGE